MAKFSGASTRATGSRLASPVQTTDDLIPTFEGGGAYRRTAESDLFLLGVTNMVGEDTFYESGAVRDKRFIDLVHVVTKGNPTFISGNPEVEGRVGFARYLRETMLMRSASVVLACEYVAAGGPHGRRVIDAVCQRPDEPAEVLGYWLANHGRKVPMPVKRGLADAVRRLYHERSALRWDGQSKAIRFADVIEFVHPAPRSPAQATLFKYLLDQRHHSDGVAQSDVLPILSAAKDLDKMTGDELRAFIRENGAETLNDAGYSWERLSGKTKMDAEAWSMIIGSMGVMALVRNLRNFDQAGITDEVVDQVIAKITDPAQVTKARLFPYQVWAAYREAPSDNWKRALGHTLDLTTQNIPSDLDGTLVVIDCSGSMHGSMSNKSKLDRWEVAAVMGAATQKGTKGSDVVVFGDTNAKLDIPAGTSALKIVERVKRIVDHNEVGSSTFGHTAIRDHFDPKRHKRVVLLTDDQMWDSAEGDSHARRNYGHRGRPPVNLDHVPVIYTYNLAGYAPSALQAGVKGRYSLGGFSDGSFRMMSVLESGRDANWQF